jgi:hypothetical protein
LESKLKKAVKKLRKPQKQVAPLVRGPLNPKAKGELGELAFAHKAASLGFGVARPHGDNELYDFIVDSGERLWRVQVKTTCKVHDYRYQTSSRHGLGVNTRPYTAKEIDFIVAYVAPLGIWYIIPVKHVTASTALSFYPSGCRQGSGRFEAYREAWHLLAPGGDLMQPGILRRIRAVACKGNAQQSQDMNPAITRGSIPPMGSRSSRPALFRRCPAKKWKRRCR